MKQETLVTCPNCKTSGFTPRGLKAHRCDGVNRKALTARTGRPVSTLAEFENLGPVSPADPGAKFALVNEYHELARASMAQSCAYMILAGVELLALKADAEHGTWEGMFPDGRGGKCQNGLAFGFSRETARSYMRLADAAKKRAPELRELTASNTPLALMPPEQREKLVTAVRKTGDGQTYGELAKEWGLVKKPPGNGGGSQKGGDDAPKLTPQQLAEQAAQDLFHPLALALYQASSEGEKQKLYQLPITSDAPGDITGLADLRDHVSAFLALVDTALADKKKAARREGK